ncbi:MAG: hypothetical protein ABID79_00590 [Elusimicrobiota bacterium]
MRQIKISSMGFLWRNKKLEARNKKRSYLLLFTIYCLLFAVFTGCATKAVVKKDYNFSAIKKVAVFKFSGNGGEAVSNEFIRQFLASGVNVVDRTSDVMANAKSLNVDAVVSGHVTEFNPSNKLLIFKEHGDIVIANRVYPISGTTVTSTGSSFGLEDANVYSVSASVSISVKMTDIVTDEIVWSDSNCYEALDINTAVKLLASSFKKSLKRYWKELE